MGSTVSFASLPSVRQRAHTHNVPILSPETRVFLEQHLRSYRPQRCLEIGTAIGVSTRCIAQTIAEWQGYITSFEVSYPSYMTACLHLSHAQVYNATLYHADVLGAPLHRLLPASVDFLFIDGMKAHYSRYINTLSHILVSWGSVIFDDVGQYQSKINTQDLQRELTRLDFLYELHPLHDNDAVLVAYKQ